MSRAAHACMVFSRATDDGWGWTWMCRDCEAGTLSVRHGEFLRRGKFLRSFRPGRDGWKMALRQAADHTAEKAEENRRYAEATGADALDSWSWRVTVGELPGGHLSAYACAQDRDAVARWAQETTGQTPLIVPLPRRL